MIRCLNKAVCLNVLAGVAYFVAAWFGNLLATQPSHASPVWPAAGVALAFMLVYGRTVIPGIFIGALIAQSFVFLSPFGTANLLESLAVGCLTGVGAYLQAWLGMGLINRWVGHRDALIEDQKIVRFFVFIALSCLVSASVGTASLYFRGVIGHSNLANSWFTWWIGDTIGASVFAPITLLFIGRPLSIWRVRRRLSLCCWPRKRRSAVVHHASLSARLA